MCSRSFRPAAALLAALLLGGCNSYSLRYRAQPQPKYHHVYADFTPLQDAVGFSIDTDGRRLEEVYVKKGDGTVVHPVSIAYPGFGRNGALFPGIGVGGGHVVGGIGVGIPIGPKRAEGLTTATFEQSAVGAPPWELHVKIQGMEEAEIPGVGGPATGK
ncbi:MAG TPA: hypothetical protein VHQ47_05115 [Phycisphaerae bacterium]|jgi:hypothetical protein|nr:hypothetical protein [Phycisphaerae bacterium]